ncbi:MAG: sugar phosphate isomerase/epimerase [Rhizobiaceae bacterium]|nr:sugar phosphate isomerase/epimerase [Rhizobiaceae bacterium]
MAKSIELLAGYWTIAGDRYPMGPSEVSPFSLRERAEAAAGAGYTGLGLVYQDIQANVEKMGLKGMRRLFDDTGIKHVEVEFLGDWFELGDAKSESDRVRKDLLEAAVELGARDLKIAPKMWAEEIDIAHYAKALAEVADEAAKNGIDVAIEVLPFTNIRDLTTARAVVGQSGRGNAGLCVDIWHMERGNIAMSEVAKLPASYIKSVELNDARAEIVGTLWDDTIGERLYPGEGSFDVTGFIRAIRQTGWEGFWSVEVLSRTYRTGSLKEQAKRSFDTTMELLTKA